MFVDSAQLSAVAQVHLVNVGAVQRESCRWTYFLIGRKCLSSSHQNLPGFAFLGDSTCIPTPPCTWKFDHFSLGNLIICILKTLLVLKLTAWETLLSRSEVVNGLRMCTLFDDDI